MRAADLFRGVRFHVEHVEMTRPTPLEEEDDRLGARLGTFPLGLSAEQLRQRQTEQAEAADFEHLPARQRRRVEPAAGGGSGTAFHGVGSFSTNDAAGKIYLRSTNSFAFNKAQGRAPSAPRL